jgi:hypothetical protein
MFAGFFMAVTVVIAIGLDFLQRADHGSEWAKSSGTVGLAAL